MVLNYHRWLVVIHGDSWWFMVMNMVIVVIVGAKWWLMRVKQCQKTTHDWEGFIVPNKMLKLGGLFIIVLPALIIYDHKTLIRPNSIFLRVVMWGVLKMGDPQNQWMSILEWSNDLGYPHFRKPPKLRCPLFFWPCWRYTQFSDRPI